MTREVIVPSGEPSTAILLTGHSANQLVVTVILHID